MAWGKKARWRTAGNASSKAAAAVARREGALNVAQVVRVRMRYFTDSVALGSQAWV